MQVGGAVCAIGGVRYYSDVKNLVQKIVQLSCKGMEIKMRIVTGMNAYSK